ncbi:MAG: holo-ACP synthase [Chloroflexi bacterium]|nr:holo-ACP synthase [Chloroflexota bacterium]
MDASPLATPISGARLHSGVDLIEIERVRDVHRRHGGRFLDRIYTAREQDYCGDRLHELAARFAAKEAVMKALGTGARGVGWREIEVLANARGKPVVLLHGRARARANRLDIRSVEVSMTHERSLACAFAIATSAAATSEPRDRGGGEDTA